MGAETWSELVVMILDGCFMLGLLLLLRCSNTGSNLTELALVFSIGEDLETSLLLGLHGMESSGFLLVRFQHLLLSQLVVSLVHNGLLLSCVQSLEVVWLDTMWGEGRLLGCWVLGHEVVIQSEILVMSSLELLLSHPCGILISLLFGHLCVSLLVCDEHVLSVLVVLSLCSLKQLDEVVLLLGESIISALILLLVERLLADLLGGPVSLL